MSAGGAWAAEVASLEHSFLKVLVYRLAAHRPPLHFTSSSHSLLIAERGDLLCIPVRECRFRFAACRCCTASTSADGHDLDYRCRR